MLLFNFSGDGRAGIFTDISKHPMLLFNFSGDGRAGIFTDISKHPMLLFNRSFDSKTYQTFLFQNILCYCLTSQNLTQYACKA